MRWPLANSPTLETLLVVLLVFVFQLVASAIGLGIEWFALAAPFALYPWTIVTSVYAHASITHLAMNAVALLVFGLLVERTTTRGRFHAFVITTGAIAGITEVLVSGTFGGSVAVLGISGAVFALMGYVVAGNPLADAMVGWLEPDRRTQILAVVVLAGAVTLVTASQGVALVAHFTGFALGLVSGRLRLLRVEDRSRYQAYR